MVYNPTSNKGLAVVKTSLIVSFICATSMGTYFTMNHKATVSEFISVSYLAFINNLVMPVSLATLMYFMLFSDHHKNTLASFTKKLIVLSGLALLLIFFWNSLDVLFHLQVMFDSETVMNNIMEKFMLGSILCFPIALMVTIIYRIFASEKADTSNET